MAEEEDEWAAAEALLQATSEGGRILPPFNKDAEPVVGDIIEINYGLCGINSRGLGQAQASRRDYLPNANTKIRGVITSIHRERVNFFIYFEEKDKVAANWFSIRTDLNYAIEHKVQAVESDILVDEVDAKKEAFTLMLEKRFKAGIDSVMEKTAERRKIVEEMVEEIHPGEWDLSPIPVGFGLASGDPEKPNFMLIVRFPEVELTNSEGDTHDLHDLYIFLTFDYNMDHNSTVYGMRGKITYPELRSNYRHSHLGTSDGSRYSAFCTGGGDTPTSKAINSVLADKWAPNTLRTLLVLYYSMANWESVEGGPYTYMRDISDAGNGGVYTPGRSQIEGYRKLFIEKYETFPTKLNANGMFNEFTVDPNDPELEAMITDLVSEEDKVVKSLNGAYNNRVTNTDERRSDILSFNQRVNQDTSDYDKPIFKGTPIVTQCIDDTNIPVDDNVIMVANPAITREIARYLEEKINEYYLKLDSYELETVQ